MINGVVLAKDFSRKDVGFGGNIAWHKEIPCMLYRSFIGDGNGGIDIE